MSGKGGGRGPEEYARWTRTPLGAGQSLYLMTACFTDHRYAPHAHHEFAVGVCTDGAEVIDYRGERIRARPGSIVVLGPGEAHTGGPAGDEGYAYRAFYPSMALLTDGACTDAHFAEPVIDDPALAAALRAAHVAVDRGAEPLEAESRLPWLLAALARRHGRARPAAPARLGGGVARAVRDRLADELTDPPSLAAIGCDLGLSRYQVLRAFRDTMGMPPYAWLAQYRVERARGLLEAGHRPAEVAGLVGFADQAHLTRWFRRVLGATPAAYRRSVRP
ncbi:AraC family transcriptional regulator [Streptomyces sp. B8F3]|uniref:helix-turn-helix domain-containing protein n=1 Tax=unclassified Streptomyces TaxID=2593676 RepID=UPI00325EF71B